MRIMLTGSCGFLLSNFIIYALQETNWDMISIDKLAKSKNIKNVPQVKRHKLYIGDICDKNLIEKIFEVEKPDILIHGAIESDINKMNDLIKTNVVGTYNLFDLAQKYRNLKKIINISGHEIYGHTNGSVDESAKLCPNSVYSGSKMLSDLLGQSYFDLYKLPVITVRCSNNFGPRQGGQELIPKTIIDALKNKEIICKRNKDRKNWTYIKDTFFAIKKIIEVGKIGEFYNVGSDEEKESHEVVKLILEIMNRGEHLVKFVDGDSSEENNCSLNSTKLKKLGWLPQYKFEDALRHTVGWIMANGKWAYNI